MYSPLPQLSLGLLLFGALLAACSNEVEQVVTSDESRLHGDSIEIIPELPRCYAYEGATSTRASADGDDVTESSTTAGETTNSGTTTKTLRYFRNNSGKWPTPEFLDLEETVWLSYQPVELDIKENADGTLDTTVIAKGAEDTKPYVVRGYANTRSLYACGITETTTDGKTWITPNSEVSSVPLYLPMGWYKFRVISPALPICKEEGEQNYCSLIENGVYFASSDERYKNTCGFSQQVDNTTGTGVKRIVLNPMVWQVARLRFTIERDDPQLSLGVMKAGIEVSGLQRPITEANEATYYNWRSGTDTIPMRRGDKYEWVRISGEDCTVAGDSMITADVGVLPTNAMSTSIVVLFNLSVNGVPTQYEAHVNQKILEHGHSYHMKVKVSLTSGITVMSWMNDSWTTTVKYTDD